MNDIYGQNNPIFLNKIRIGGKSNTAIRTEFSRLVKKGELYRESKGIYYIKGNEEFGNVISFDEILDKKFIHTKSSTIDFGDLFIDGYYSGLTFLNMIGISQQVPSIPEITTNNTSSKKRFYHVNNRTAVIRKGKCEINHKNFKILQFLDSFHWMNENDIKVNKKLLTDYIQKNHFTKNLLNEYIRLYGFNTIKMIIEGGLIDAFA